MRVRLEGKTHQRDLLITMKSLSLSLLSLSALSPQIRFPDLIKKMKKIYVSLSFTRPTVVLVGAPNVGKSTLIRELSSGEPEVGNYAFTTRLAAFFSRSETRFEGVSVLVVVSLSLERAPFLVLF